MDRPKMTDITGVRYNGEHGVTRILEKADLKALGLGSLKLQELRWDDENNYIVPIESLSAEAVDVLIGMPEFEVV